MRDRRTRADSSNGSGAVSDRARVRHPVGFFVDAGAVQFAGLVRIGHGVARADCKTKWTGSGMCAFFEQSTIN